MAKIELTQEIVKKLLDYDPVTGDLTWRYRDETDFLHLGDKADAYSRMFNKQFAGKKALHSVMPIGYRGGSIYDQKAYAHRIIWLWMTGENPKTIDHKNGIKIDNRWENLRNITQKQNTRNQTRRNTNTTGHTGVFRHRGKYKAQIMIDAKTYHLGVFDDILDAARAYKEAAIKAGFDKTHGEIKY